MKLFVSHYLKTGVLVTDTFCNVSALRFGNKGVTLTSTSSALDFTTYKYADLLKITNSKQEVIYDKLTDERELY